MKYSGILVLIVVLAVVLVPIPAQATSLRIVGYFNFDPFNQINNVEYSKLSHVIWEGCACTSNTDPTLRGNWGQLSTLRAKTSASGTKLLASVMGGNWTAYPLTTIVANSNLRATLVTNLAKLVSTYSLDGIDIDWEGTDVSQANYHALLVQLRAALPPGKLISVCGPARLAYQPATDYQYWFNPTTDTPLVDMYELMLYGIDFPAEATYSDFVTYSQMWINAGFTAAKLNLGMPATACDSSAEITAYRQVVIQLNPATHLNYANVSTIPNWNNTAVAVQGGVLWWNGYDLAVSKTQWAQRHNVGGMMIWAIDNDAAGNTKSLLSGVYSALWETPPPSQTPTPTPTPTLVSTPTPSVASVPIPTLASTLTLTPMLTPASTPTTLDTKNYFGLQPIILIIPTALFLFVTVTGALYAFRRKRM